MIGTNYSTLRENMKSLFDRVTDESETLLVTRKGGMNVVVVSEDAYNNMQENLYLMGDRTNRDWLLESRRQLEEGTVIEHGLTDTSAGDGVHSTSGKTGAHVVDRGGR
ncbi:MAG: type II toxin-antitoxin system Phd/YefM family antitoxin [Olegusella sp.]|nr:type II toxin-antitoxin system Phd/YefM family antitoxin [Olegusella sp.]